MSTPTINIPGYVAGTWDIDQVHSSVSIVARHFVVSKVRGEFRDFTAQIVTGENPLDSSVTATIQAASIDTHQEQRDDHIRSADFLEVETHPTITFTSAALRPHGSDFQLDGELTLHGVTKPVTLDLELNGFGPDGYGGTRLGLSASTAVSRKDFDIRFNGTIEGTGGAIVSDKLEVKIELEAVLQKA
jgi:polyisoprenoid-binding protein YceI